MTPQLPNMFVHTVLRFARAQGYSEEELLDGLDVPADALKSPTGRVDYPTAVELLERLERCHPRALALLAEHYAEAFPLVTWVASYVTSAQTLYRLAAHGWSRIWPVRITVVEEEKRQLHLAAHFLRKEDAAPVLFRLMTHALRALPLRVGQRAARVDAEAQGGMAMSWHVRLAGDSLPPDPVAPEVLFDALQRGPLAQLAPQPAVPAEWRLTAGESAVVLRIVAGKSVREIAAELELSPETVRTHLKRAMAKAGVHRQAELVTAVLAPTTTWKGGGSEE